MARRNDEEFSVKAGQIVGQAQVKRDDCKDSNSSGYLQQKGEQVKNMAQEASEAVKNKLGMSNEYKNKNPLDKKNPNNTTCPSMPGHPSADV